MQKTARIRTLIAAFGVTSILAYSVHRASPDTAPAWEAFWYAPAQAAERGPSGHHGQSDGKDHGLMFLRGLQLTDAQRTELKALHADLRTQMQARKPAMQENMAQLKQAFLSERFDAAAVKAQLRSAHARNSADMAPKMATHLIRVYQLLTPEQRQQVEERLGQMEAQTAAWQQKSGARQGRNPLQAMAAKLSLSEAQHQQLASLWQQGQAHRSEGLLQLRGLKQQVLAELQAPQPSASKLAQILAPRLQHMGQSLERHVEQMAALHAILTPQQRQQLVELMEAKRPHHGRRGVGQAQ
ncbi:MAG: Spy/CpxP family protein refolding chaperone [Candidatus Sericytochromatia bacterium]